MDIKMLQQLASQFRDERDWAQFHSPENLAKSISIEAAELLECFQWNNNYSQEEVAAEMADVLTYLLLMADATGIDIENAFTSKLEESALKYPVEKAKGQSTKYDKL